VLLVASYLILVEPAKRAFYRRAAAEAPRPANVTGGRRHVRRRAARFSVV
jgi:hypothetical protein